jgi:hypothetical protein
MKGGFVAQGAAAAKEHRSFTVLRDYAPRTASCSEEGTRRKRRANVGTHPVIDLDASSLERYDQSADARFIFAQVYLRVGHFFAHMPSNKLGQQFAIVAKNAADQC